MPMTWRAPCGRPCTGVFQRHDDLERWRLSNRRALWLQRAGLRD